MLFEWLQVLSWPWLIAAHLIAIGLLAAPFAYVFVAEQVGEMRRIFGTQDAAD